jgi:hypothetical protein
MEMIDKNRFLSKFVVLFFVNILLVGLMTFVAITKASRIPDCTKPTSDEAEKEYCASLTQGDILAEGIFVTPTPMVAVTNSPIPLLIYTPTGQPSSSNFPITSPVIAFKDNKYSIQATAGSIIIINETTETNETCAQFHQLSFKARNDIVGNLNLSPNDDFDFKYDKAQMYSGCKITLENFKSSDVEDIRIKSKISDSWVKDNNFNVTAIKLVDTVSENTASIFYDLKKVEDVRQDSKDFDVLETSIKDIPSNFAVLSTVPPQEKAQFPKYLWLFIVLSLGIFISLAFFFFRKGNKLKGN